MAGPTLKNEGSDDIYCTAEELAVLGWEIGGRRWTLGQTFELGNLWFWCVSCFLFPMMHGIPAPASSSNFFASRRSAWDRLFKREVTNDLLHLCCSTHISSQCWKYSQVSAFTGPPSSQISATGHRPHGVSVSPLCTAFSSSPIRYRVAL